MARSRYKFKNNENPYFMTCTVVHWLPVFSSPIVANIIIDSLKFLQKENVVIYAWVMLENHIHIIAKSEDMSRDIARFKAYTAKKILAYLIERNAKTILDQLKYYKISYKGKDREIQFWQEGVHPQMICDEIMMCQKVDYIHQNHVKRGFVDEVVHWRYSSARNYLGYVGLLHVCTDWNQ